MFYNVQLVKVYISQQKPSNKMCERIISF